MPRKLSKEQIQQRCVEKFGDKFTYDLSDYKNIAKSKVSITCPDHGSFQQTIKSHFNSPTGCPKCSIVQFSQRKKALRMNRQSVEEDAQQAVEPTSPQAVVLPNYDSPPHPAYHNRRIVPAYKMNREESPVIFNS